MNQMRKQLEEAFPNDIGSQRKWSELLGVENIRDEISAARNAITTEFTDQTGHIKLSQDQIGELYGLSLEDLRIYSDLVKDGVYDTWDDLQTAFNKTKKKLASEKDGTLATLLGDESYKESAEKYRSTISTITSAMETLRSEGTLTGEEMTSLREAFTDFGENITLDDLSTKSLEQLTEWMSKFREAMKGMSGDELKQTQLYLRDLFASFGDLGLTEDQVRNAFVELRLGESKSGSAGIGRSDYIESFNSKIEELRSRLPEGEELDMQIVAELMLTDQFSGPAQQIYDAYNDMKLHWSIILENKEIDRDIENIQSKISRQQARNSLKEAKGGIIDASDLHGVTEYSRGIAEDRRAQYENALDYYNTISGYDAVSDDYKKSVYKTVMAAETAMLESQAEVANNEKAEIEAQANRTLRDLERRNNEVTKAQNELDAAENEYGKGKAPQEFYDNLERAILNRKGVNDFLSYMYQAMADANPQYRNEFMEKALSYSSAAESDKQSATTYEYSQQQKNLNILQENATRIQRELTEAEQKHQKVSKQTYSDLIQNAKAQIQNLRQEQAGVGDNIDKWREYQDQIESLNDSIYDWQSTMDSLVVDQASSLASTLSSAVQEAVSGTGLTRDTINALFSGFSDITGKDLDISDAFYNTADGIKVSTSALQEMTEAEYKMVAANLDEEINAIKNAMSGYEVGSTIWNRYNDQLQTLMQTQSQFFAQYQQMQQALSHNNLMSIAESTPNQGANYDANYERRKKYQEAYEKGLTGTDDFQEFTSYIDEWGRNTAKAYGESRAKAERYLTEDAKVGAQNFLNDLQTYGMAEQGADGYWTIRVNDMAEAAHQLGIGAEFLEDMFGKLEEYDFKLDFVGSPLETDLKVQGLEGDLQEQVKIYQDMLQNGATEDALQDQLNLINSIGERIGRVNEYGDDWLNTEEMAKRNDFAKLEKDLDNLTEAYKNAENDAAREAFKKQAQDRIKQYGYSLNEEELKSGRFVLSEESLGDYKSRITAGTREKPLTAEQMGYGIEGAQAYKDAQDQINSILDERQDLFESLAQYSREELRNIDHADGKWSAGEKEIEALCDALGVSYDNADDLINALAGMGLIQAPEFIDQIPDKMREGKESVKEFLDNVRGGLFKDMNLDADITKMDTKALDDRIERLNALRRNFAEESSEYQYLTGELDKAEAQKTIQVKIEGGESVADLKALLEDDSKLAAEFGIDLNEEGAEEKLAAIKEQIESMDAEYDMKIHVDDQQFEDLIEAITSEPYKVKVEADTDEAKEAIDKLVSGDTPTVEPKVRGAAAAIAEEGTAAEEAAVKKEQFVEANKDVQSSAEGTAELTENAGNSIFNSVQQTLHKVDNETKRNTIHQNQDKQYEPQDGATIDKSSTPQSLSPETTEKIADTITNLSDTGTELVDGAMTALGDAWNRGLEAADAQQQEKARQAEEAARQKEGEIAQKKIEAQQQEAENRQRQLEEQQKRLEELRKRKDEEYSPNREEFKFNKSPSGNGGDAHDMHKMQGSSNRAGIELEDRDFNQSADNSIVLTAEIDDSTVDKEVDRIKTKVEGSSPKITPEVNESGFLSKVKNLVIKAQSVTTSSGASQQKQQSAQPSAQPQQKVQGAAKQVTQTQKTKLEVDTSNFDQSMAKANSELDQIAARTATPIINVNDGPAQSKIQSFKATFQTLNSLVARPQVTADGIDTAIQRVNSLLGQLNQLNRTFTTTHTIKTVKEGEALGTAHVSGTAKIGGINARFKRASAIARAFVGGTQDWTVGRNEKALVNELGQESLVS